MGQSDNIDTVTTTPHSNEKNLPTEFDMKGSKRRASPTPGSEPILGAESQTPNYQSVTSTSGTGDARNRTDPGNAPENQDRHEQHQEEERVGILRRIWNLMRQWERDHLKLVLENKGSVARDHLGILAIV
jgi:hypothetical protein